LYLRKVELRGFKTFADRTELEFGPGITAIVGPNGVGKSNISDGILWALGEQSNRALRTQASQDVIFAGSERRRPIGMAEVSVTIDNSDGQLAVDYSEIIVSRRLFRSGESEYLLNRSTARLKDVRDLLLDTGVGPDAYSVIGQGEIDAILSIRSEDRRELLEEVAGIRKYRVRRDEATRKLEATQANMTRVADILAELKSQRRPLETEAERARQYKEMADRLRDLDLHLLAGDYQRRRQRIGKLTNDLEVTRADHQATRNRMSQLDSEHERVQFELARLGDEVDRLRDEANRAERELDQARQARMVLEERLRAAAARQTDLQVTLEGHERRSKELSGQLESVSAELEETATLRSRAEQERAQWEEELKARSEEFRVKTGAIRELEQKQAEVLKRAAALENEALTLRGVEGDLTERVERLSRQAETFAQRELELSEALNAARARREELELSTQQRTEQLQELRANLARSNRTLQEHRQKCNIFSGAVTTAEAQQELLTQLERSREGFSDGVKSVLKAAEEGTLQGIHGIVADLVDVPVRFERAIEMALGEALQWVVVETDEQAATAARFVCENGIGRVTFLPLSSLAAATTPAGADQITGPGIVGPALRNVRIRREYQKLFDKLLGSAVIVRDLDTALSAAQRARTRLRIVTLTGEVIHPDGSITVGGEEGAGAQAFIRRRELEALSAELEVMREYLAEMWRREENLDQWSGRLGEEIHGVEAELASLQSRKAAAETDITHLADQQKAARGAGLELSEEARTLTQRLQSAVTRREEAEAQGEQLRLEGEDLGRQIERARADGVSQAEVDACRARHVNAQVAAAELSEKQRSLQHLKDRYSNELQRAASDSEAIREELAQAREVEERLREEFEAPGDEINRLEQVAGTARGQVNEGARALSELREKSASLEAARKKLAAVADEQADRTHRTEIAITREEAQIEVIVQRLDDAYGMTPEEAFAERSEEVNEREIRGEALQLREAIHKLGPVNLSAIDECERLRAREEFLENQVADLEAARADLLRVIQEIDQVATEEFMRCFERMQEEFRAMFTRLFGGGQTELKLTDEEKPLESGLDVIVQIPGKRQQNLLLLSGGERSLTAMALIFAMLRVKPSPFCLMDEIDAALDEANVGRFVDVLQDFAKESQFIIVTHNPHTIQAADVLFGVTMEDAGVSRIIKLELREWEDFLADAEQKVAAVRAPRAGTRVLPTQT